MIRERHHFRCTPCWTKALLAVITLSGLLNRAQSSDGGSEMTVVVSREQGVQVTLRLSEERMGSLGSDISGIPAEGSLQEAVKTIVQEIVVEHDNRRLPVENVRILDRNARSQQIVKLTFPAPPEPEKLKISLSARDSLRLPGHEGYAVRMQSEGDRHIREALLTPESPILIRPDWKSIPVSTDRDFSEQPEEMAAVGIANPASLSRRGGRMRVASAGMEPTTPESGSSWAIVAFTGLAAGLAVAGWLYFRRQGRLT